MPPPSKRRKTDSAIIEEITFDLDARQDYLTGFHKRKLQRAKHAKEIAEKKARADRIEHRRKLREERKQDVERHVAEVNALLKPIEQISGASSADEDSDEQEWDGVLELPVIDQEAEYIDEDRYTTVTIEAMDLSRDGLDKAEKEVREGSESLAEEKPESVKAAPVKTQGKKVWTRQKPDKESQVARKKRKKFRYENKAERKMTRSKEKLKNSKQAKARRAA